MIMPKMNNNQQKLMKQALDQQKLMKLAIDQPNDRCQSCEHTVYVQRFFIKTISRLISGAAMDMHVPIPIYACAKCGRPHDIKTEKESLQ